MALMVGYGGSALCRNCDARGRLTHPTTLQAEVAGTSPATRNVSIQARYCAKQ
jgi:hypothetical protein